jgi:hypothetical protein
VVDTLPHVSDVYLGCQLLLLLISIYILWLWVFQRNLSVEWQQSPHAWRTKSSGVRQSGIILK